MRNLKRMLSLALAAAMLMSMMVVSAGASYENFTDSDEIVNTEAVNAMVNLGLLVGNNDGSFNPEGTVTRGQMAKIIALILNGGEDPTDYTCEFYDVVDTGDGEAHWAYQYIAYCYSRGIIVGYTNDPTGEFGPSDEVTGTQAAKMILVAMGYDAETEGMAGDNYSSNNILFLADTVGNKLFDDVSVTRGDAISRDDVSEVIFTALNCGTVSYDSDGNVQRNATTLLEESFAVELVTGVVVANDYADIDASLASATAGYTYIVVADEDGTYTLTTAEVKYEGESGASVLGQVVSFYADGDTVIGAITATSDNVVVTSTDDVADILEDNDLSLSDNVAYYDNYVVDDATLSADAYTLVDFDGDDYVDYVFGVTYSFGQVTAYDADAETASIDGTKVIRSSGYCVEDEEVVGFEDIAEDDYINYIVVNGVIYLEVAETVTGEFTRYSTTTVTVDGTAYDYTSAVTPGTDITTGEEVTLYFGVNGEVVKAENVTESTSTENYAYFIDAIYEEGTTTNAYGKEENSGVYTAQAQVILADGTSDVYNVASVDSSVFDEDATTWTALENLAAGIYEYGINSDGELVLTATSIGSTVVADYTTDVTDGGVANNDITVTNGSMTVTLKTRTVDDVTTTNTLYATDDTVYYYVDAEGDVSVYVGYDNAPSLDIKYVAGVSSPYDDAEAGAYYYALYSGTELLAIYVETENTAAVFDGDWMYIYEETDTATDGTYYNVILDGADTEILIDNASYSVGFYEYTVEDGIYTVSAITETADKLISNVGTSYGSAVIGGTELSITSDTVVFEVIDCEADVTNITLATDNVVTYVLDSNGDLLVVVITCEDYYAAVESALDDLADLVTSLDEADTAVSVSGVEADYTYDLVATNTYFNGLTDNIESVFGTGTYTDENGTVVSTGNQSGNILVGTFTIEGITTVIAFNVTNG